MRENGNDVLFCDCVGFCMCPVKENLISFIFSHAFCSFL